MPETPLPKPGPVLDEARDWPPVLTAAASELPAYAELHCLTNFSFQRGASHPQELVRRAYDLGYDALAITDECSVAGVVRAWSGWNEYRRLIERLEAARPAEPRLRDFRLLFGSEFDLGDAWLVAIARDLHGWGGLCEFITRARMKADKGCYDVGWETSDFSLLAGCEILYVPGADDGAEPVDFDAVCAGLERARAHFGAALWLAVESPHRIDDDLRLATLLDAAERTGVPAVAAGGVRMHARSRKPLHDVITAVRMGRPVADCGFALEPNAERHLRARARLAEVHPHDLLARTLEVMKRCTFDLASIRYDYPLETVPEGLTPTAGLRKLTMEGAAVRYPRGIPDEVVGLLEKELALIEDCHYEMFFLTVHDIVRFARSEGILCQGRGSAANSVVCFCLGITAMDPMHSAPLLERFISVDRRNEPPDIDVDFEHERREEVIQYIYAKYGRERAAIAATVVGYRTRSAIRDVGAALGVPPALVDAFAKDHHWFDEGLAEDRLPDLVLQAAQTGETCEPHRLVQWLVLAHELLGFPRHLSQHVGGFVLTQTRLVRLVPVENASMKDRSVIQWDKDDLEDMGLMKVDVLALGMLTAIRRCVDLVAQRRGAAFGVLDIPPHDETTFEMIRRADTVGVFQIESRAQMSMLPRLKPAVFYDLVVEVAIVRPGPITGGMVHPYLKARERRRQGLPIVYERSSFEPKEGKARLEKALARTLGVPIFQEQVMEISMIAAGFTATDADSLRRAMAAWKRTGGVDKFEARLKGGMLANGYTADFAERIFKQVKGFGDYGFPESHAYSFALLAWDSCWLKCHEPECFLAAMLNSQPMGFYSASQLVQDARRHGIVVRPADVSASDWDCTLEDAKGARWTASAVTDAAAADNASPSRVDANSNAPKPVVRLGLRLVGSLRQDAATRIVQARGAAPFADAEDLALRAALDVRDMNALAAGDALLSIAGHRRQQAWDAAGRRSAPARLLEGAPMNEAPLALEQAHEGEEIVFDYASLGLTLRRHPLALLRPRLLKFGARPSSELQDLAHGARAHACGIVNMRQRPPTAKGTMFITLEDEDGIVNVIVWKDMVEAQRDALLRSRLLSIRGVWQRDVESGGRVRHLLARQAVDLTPWLGRLADTSASRDFH